MTWGRRCVGASLVGGWAALLTGCAALSGPLPADGRVLAADITPTPEPRLTRSQRPEPMTRPSPMDLSAPPPLRQALATAPATAAPEQVIRQASALVVRGQPRVHVVAWVNGQPIFDDEVRQMAGPALEAVRRLPEPTRSEKAYIIRDNVLETLIDQEVMYQDAMKKLEKAPPSTMAKLKEFTEQEFEKKLTKLRKAKFPEEQIKEVEPVLRRLNERGLISMEYVRNRIMPQLPARVTLEVIKEYYDTHPGEFVSEDKVQWQDVFLALGPSRPTVAHARKDAERMLASLRSPDDFTKLLAHDDGDGKLRGGEGHGQRRARRDEKGKIVQQDIRPPEVEPYLFELKPGEIGPIVELPTGVHLIRVLKREYAGQMPLDERLHKEIRKKLENQFADREYRRIVRELRARTVIVKEGNEH